MSPKIVFTYSGTNLHQGVEILKDEWKDTFPNVSWNYEFVDEKIKAQYDNETRLNKLIAVATFLSIIIAVLGLFGLIMIRLTRPLGLKT